MTTVYVVQHGEKERLPGDPGLTARGREQAALAAKALQNKDLTMIYASPLRRAIETAEPLAAACGLEIQVDARATERMNWDGSTPIAQFFEDWTATTADRDFVPAVGDSSRAAGGRFRDFLVEQENGDAAIAVAAHGGVTVDLLRTLLGDEAVPGRLLREGIPSGAITTLDGLRVKQIAAISHLEGLESAHRPD
ncbi:histidine phosphatase family protein [Glycomyces buryatensis]|uniref:Histidine phosphatase family protein n=1 Tax=Glycomyces buryatensis TaxID=2570927 RepID=A0A4S8PWX0_9ACTN|nr:histidine phosphatase family protein [Glycomyces buryatensis]THV34392.1 histidine phosphatase family protein [Glycomyces buryatensis]